MLKYRTEQWVAKIRARILVTFDDDKEQIYESGIELANAEFDKYYLIDKISVKDDMITIKMKENDKLFDLNWIGKEAVSSSTSF